MADQRAEHHATRKWKVTVVVMCEVAGRYASHFFALGKNLCCVGIDMWPDGQGLAQYLCRYVGYTDDIRNLPRLLNVRLDGALSALHNCKHRAVFSGLPSMRVS